jgi:hypothetical protein
MSSQSDPYSATVSWVSLGIANGVGWLNGEFAGQIVSFLSILVFGGCALYTRVAKVLDDRWLARERLKIQIKAEQSKAEDLP